MRDTVVKSAGSGSHGNHSYLNMNPTTHPLRKLHISTNTNKSLQLSHFQHI